MVLPDGMRKLSILKLDLLTFFREFSALALKLHLGHVWRAVFGVCVFGRKTSAVSEGSFLADASKKEEGKLYYSLEDFSNFNE